MSTKGLIVALLLLATLGNPAAAAEPPEHESKNARKLLAALSSMGINDPDITNLASTIDEHIDEGYLNLAERDVPGGKLALRYRLSSSSVPGDTSSRGGIKRVELHYAPDNSRWEASAAPDLLMVKYNYKF